MAIRPALLSILFSAFFCLTAGAAPHIVVDTGSGEVLLEQDSADQWYPASLTKLMSAYVTFRAISAGELKDGSPVVISRFAARQPPSKMGYRAGVQIRVDTALKIIIVKSANDVSVALAEAVAGTVKSFVARMNDEAKRLGMVSTNFVNSNGLHGQDQVTSARDMALLATTIFREYPQYLKYFASVAVKTPKKLHYSYNLLLERFEGANGMKTGFVCASGYNMVASASRNGRNLLAVVLGRSSQTDRAVEAARLLEAGFKVSSGSRNLFVQPATTGNPAKNMRPILCTETARKNRYEPGAGLAVVKSEFLNERVKSDAVLSINIGGVDAEPSAAYMALAFQPKGKVPKPVRRPFYEIVNVDGVKISSSLTLRGTLPVPVRRPVEQ